MLLKRKYLFGTTVLAGVMAASLPAFAQSTSTNTSTTNQDPEEGAVVEDVVVVGSRIRRDTYNSPSPIQVITRDDAVLAGFSTTTDVLQGTAVTGGSAQINGAYGGFVTNGGPGANTLSLRGLGATRTLVLLNGRRVAPAGSRGSVGSADLNVLPSAMVERVDVLRDGASSIYGSDAIAGVVNIITRNNIDRISIDAQHNFTTDANGAGDTTRIAIVGGTSGDRWNISGSAEYFTREETTLNDRDFTRCQTDNFIAPRSDFIDPLTGRPKCYGLSTGAGSNGVTINTIGTSTRTSDPFVTAAGGITLLPGLVGAQGVPQVAYDNGVYFDRFRPNSGVTTGLIGFEGVGGAYLNSRTAPTAFLSLNTNIRDTFEPRMNNRSLFQPIETMTAFLQGSYDLGFLGNAEFYTEFLANRRESSQTGYRQLSLDYRRGSVLIPSNLQFSNFAAPSVITGTDRIGVRAFIGYGNDQSSQRVDFVKSLAGMRGDFILPDWRYDVYASHTTSNSDYVFEQFLIDRLSNSLDVVAAPAGTPASLTRTGTLGTTNTTGTVTCRVNITNPAANCIPAPFLTTQTIGGQLPEDWKEYVFRPITGNTQYTETVINAGIDGPLFTLPAGQVSAFLGAEFREAKIDDSPAADMISANLYNFSTATPTRGTDNVWEVFGEVEVPILANLPFVNELTFNASARYTDYDYAGSNETYKVQLLYSPTDWITLRGSYGTSFRAPALFEIFQGSTSGFQAAGNDPCSELNPLTANPNVLANCNTQVPANFRQTSSVRVNTLGGVANQLEAETSENVSYGVILEPPLPTGWGNVSVALDYYDIEIKNSVSRVGFAFILSDCYSSEAVDFNARASYCALITRNPSDNTLTVNDSYVNIATDRAEGLDLQMRYRNQVGPGNFAFTLGATQFLTQTSQLFATDPLRDQTGRLTTPEFSGTANATYGWDNWRVSYGVEYIGGRDEDDYRREFGFTLAAPAGFDYAVEDYYLHTASVQYRTDQFTITAGMRNLFNETPPYVSTEFTNRVGNAALYSGYDFQGRTGFVNISKTF